MITGGSGTIGFAIAKAFSKLGAQTILVDKDEIALKESVAKLGVGHKYFPIDVTHSDAANQAMLAAINNFGGLDILISNAGAAHAGPMLGISNEELRNAFELNFSPITAFRRKRPKF